MTLGHGKGVVSDKHCSGKEHEAKVNAFRAINVMSPVPIRQIVLAVRSGKKLEACRR